MDGNIAKLFPTPEANPKLYQTKCWEEANGKDHDITINCSNIMLSGVPALMHAQDEEISLYLLQSGCMVREQTHGMVC